MKTGPSTQSIATARAMSVTLGRWTAEAERQKLRDAERERERVLELLTTQKAGRAVLIEVAERVLATALASVQDRLSSCPTATEAGKHRQHALSLALNDILVAHAAAPAIVDSIFEEVA